MAEYLRRKQCSKCGQPHWIHYWVGQYCAKSRDGLSVLDSDLKFHRFRRIEDARGWRDVEDVMDVEVKTGSEKLGIAQRDTLSVFNAAIEQMIPVDGEPIHVRARAGYVRPGSKKVVHHGVHLLRVPSTPNPDGPWYWDNKPVDTKTLIGILNFELDPRNPLRRLDVARRHKAGRSRKQSELMFSEVSP
jgi:hypothetical protein